jgi:hypothetical protein
MQLVLRRANVSRISGRWQDEDYDVFDGDRDIGRIYLVNSCGGREIWFWGVSFQLTWRKSYGRADSLEAATAAFRAEYPHVANNGGRHFDTSNAVAAHATFNWTKLRGWERLRRRGSDRVWRRQWTDS